ncbi:hypothetical protein BHE74_00023531, partial [Ensete ventricosum]
IGASTLWIRKRSILVGDIWPCASHVFGRGVRTPTSNRPTDSSIWCRRVLVPSQPPNAPFALPPPSIPAHKNPLPAALFSRASSDDAGHKAPFAIPRIRGQEPRLGARPRLLFVILIANPSPVYPTRLLFSVIWLLQRKRRHLGLFGQLNVKVTDLIDIEDFVYDKVNLSANSSAVQRLSEKGLLDADAIVRTDEATMASLIYPVYP